MKSTLTPIRGEGPPPAVPHAEHSRSMRPPSVGAAEELFAEALAGRGGHEGLAPRSWRGEESMALPLDGSWAFRLSSRPSAAPDGAWLPEHDDRDWDRVSVPGHWVLQGDGSYGHPIYTNVRLPIPLDPPHAPDENPTGDYRVGFEVPTGWTRATARRLRFDGVDGAAAVHVNGHAVGVVRGSRLAQEFDVTELLVPGRNVLHVRVFQWSAQTYLEDQDQWWLPGIYREVSLIARAHDAIEDLWLRAEFHADGTGTIVPEVRSADAAWPAVLRVPGLGVDVEWASANEVGPIDVGVVEPWSADSPTLYEAVVTSPGDEIRTRLGFRSVSIEGHQWRVNGRRLRLRGVNRHEFHPDHGRRFDEVDTRQQLLLMKRSNVNAIRTSHYPPHPRLLELADELGFWVIDECDLETHAFEQLGWVGNPSDDPAWRDAYLDRIQRTVERDKQHPSIIAWSLGNESHTGANLASMAAWLRRRDPSRVIHYEGDHAGEYTDIVSRMYTSPAEMARMSAAEDASPTQRAGDAARLAQRPMMLCEYAHAMGNGPGGLIDYVEAFERLPQWHGGFVWEWRDHGLLTKSADGIPYHAYGGDFGERVHDGNFVMDGLVGSDGAPSPALAELAAAYTPIAFEVDTALIRIENRHHAIDTGHLRFRWVVETEGVTVDRGELEVDAIPADGHGTVPVPAALRGLGPDSWLTVTAELRWPTAWAEAGHVVARRQFSVRPPLWRGGAWMPRSRQPAGDSLAPVAVNASGAAHATSIRIGDIELNSITGLPVAWREQPIATAEITLWRAPTDNDALATTTDARELTERRTPSETASATVWRAAGLDTLVARTLTSGWSGDAFLVRRRLLPVGGKVGVDVEFRWSDQAGIARLDLSIAPTGPSLGTWPRAGLHLSLPREYKNARWFGYGPGEGYSDSRAAGWIGIHEAGLAELHHRYAVPQETGHRPDIRWLELFGERVPGLRIAAIGPDLPGFSLLPWSADELTGARHQHELPASAASHLVLDAAQHGLGSRSCGPDVFPEHQLWPRLLTLTLLFSGSEDTEGASEGF